MITAKSAGSIERVLEDTGNHAGIEKALRYDVPQPKADVIDIKPYLRKEPHFYLSKGQETSYESIMNRVEKYVRSENEFKHHANEILALAHYMLVFKSILQERKKTKSELLKRNILLEGAVEETMRDRVADCLDYSKLDSNSPFEGTYSEKAKEVIQEHPWFAPGRIKTDEQMLWSVLGAFKEYGKVVRNHNYLMHMVRSDKTPEPDRLEQLPIFMVYHMREFALLAMNNVPKTKYH